MLCLIRHKPSKLNLEKRNNHTGVKDRQGLWMLLMILVLILIDQATKVWVKTSMTLGQEHYIASWFRIYFIENDGMAYGITLGNKLFLTLFRLIAMSALGYYLYRIIRRRVYSLGYVACLSLVMAGGMGNVIDCVFYGQIFTESTHASVAQLVGWGDGYESLMYGRVVDMLHFPLIEGVFPDWVPFWGGEHYVFFRPIFNVADSYISVAVFLLILCYPRTLSYMLEGEAKQSHGDLPEQGVH